MATARESFEYREPGTGGFTRFLPVLAKGEMPPYFKKLDLANMTSGDVQITFYDINKKPIDATAGTVSLEVSNGAREQWFSFEKTGGNGLEAIANEYNGDSLNMPARLFLSAGGYKLPKYKFPAKWMRAKLNGINNAVENILLTNGSEQDVGVDILFNLPSSSTYNDRDKVQFYLLDGNNEEPGQTAVPLVAQDNGTERIVTLGIIRGLSNYDGVSIPFNLRNGSDYLVLAAPGATADDLAVYLFKDANMNLFAFLGTVGGADPAANTAKYLAMDILPQMITVPGSSSTSRDRTFEVTSHRFALQAAPYELQDIGVTIPSDANKDGRLVIYTVARGGNKPATEADATSNVLLDDARAWGASVAGNSPATIGSNGLEDDPDTETDPNIDEILYVGRDASDPHKILAYYEGDPGTADTSTKSARVAARVVATRSDKTHNLTNLQANSDNAGADENYLRIEFPNPGVSYANAADVPNNLPFLRIPLSTIAGLTGVADPALSARSAVASASVHTETITVAGVVYTISIVRSNTNRLFGYFEATSDPGDVQWQIYWEEYAAGTPAAERDIIVDVISTTDITTTTPPTYGDDPSKKKELIPGIGSLKYCAIDITTIED